MRLDERVLCEIIGKITAAQHTAQKSTHHSLMTLDQLAESATIVRVDDARDQHRIRFRQHGIIQRGSRFLSAVPTDASP